MGLSEKEQRILDLAVMIRAKFDSDQREKRRENVRRFRERNPEHDARYREANRKRLAEAQNRRYWANRDEELLKMRGGGKGLSADEVSPLLLVQKTCEICGLEFGDQKIDKAHIDHDHDTGEVRGLLCTRCNVGIGQFRDDPELTRKATEYLERNQPPDIGNWRPEISAFSTRSDLSLVEKACGATDN